MSRCSVSPMFAPHVTIRISGKLFEGHLPYLDHLVRKAAECRLWPLLNLTHLQELDRAALTYLMDGENRDFAIVSCPGFIRTWMDHERIKDEQMNDTPEPGGASAYAPLF